MPEPRMDFRLCLNMPESVEKIPPGCSGVHESTLRAYHVLGFVHWMLSQGCPPGVVKHFIEEAGYPR